MTDMSLPLATFDSLEDATDWVARWASLNRVHAEERLAAVFDVDATLLDGQGQPIEPVCLLLRHCRARGVHATPFVVTARSERGREETSNQLAQAGAAGYKRLYMHPESRSCKSTSEAGAQKLHWRSRIGEHGYRVCVNVGDAWHDHFSPTPPELTRALGRHRIHVFVTADGVAHLKLPG